MTLVKREGPGIYNGPYFNTDKVSLYMDPQPQRKKYTDIMVDLETLDTNPRAVVLSIGAVAFNLDEQESVKDYLYGLDCTHRSFAQRVSLDGQLPNRTISGSTFQWWMQQSDEARKALCGPAPSLFSVLCDFATWVGEVSEGRTELQLWGNGAAFDNAILRDAYDQMELAHPISFRGDMCYRTIKTRLMPGKVDVENQDLLVAHNARHDAILQAVILQKIWASLKVPGNCPIPAP